jgi:dTDP-4-dehydrorhamnose 3,5-epimerase
MPAGIKSISETELKGVKLIDLSPHNDSRGSYIQLHNNEEYEQNDFPTNFVESSSILCKKNSLRGIHGDERTWKLVSCLSGEIFEVVVNLDSQSESYGKWQSFSLSDKKPQQILIPPKHGHAFLALTDNAVLHYFQSHHRDKINFPQKTIKWNSPSLGINWPVKNPIVSDRDSEAPEFSK